MQQLQYKFRNRRKQQEQRICIVQSNDIIKLQHVLDTSQNHIECVVTKTETARMAVAKVRVAHTSEITLCEANLTTVKKENKHACTSVSTSTLTEYEARTGDTVQPENESVILQARTRSNGGDVPSDTLKNKLGNRGLNNNNQSNQNLNKEIKNRFDKVGEVHCSCIGDVDSGIRFRKKRLYLKIDNCLKHVASENANYEKSINIVQDNIINDKSDFMHAERDEHALNNSSMDQFFLTSGEGSGCSNLEKHFAVTIRGCNNRVNELNRDECKNDDGENTKKDGTDKDRNKSVINTILTDFIQGNDDSDDILMGENICPHCVVDVNSKKQNFVRNTTKSFDQQLQLQQNTNMEDGECGHVGKLKITAVCHQQNDSNNGSTVLTRINIPLIDERDAKMVHGGELGSTCQQASVDMPSIQHNFVNNKLAAKYVLQLQTKQLLAQHKQQQCQRPKQMMTVLTTSPLKIKANTLLADGDLYNAIGDDARDIKNLECINNLSEPLSQAILQRGHLQLKHCGKHSDNESITASNIPICVSVSDCVEYLNDDLEDLKVMLVC